MEIVSGLNFRLRSRFPEELAAVRLGLGLTQNDVAKAMHLHRKAISSIEQGLTRPDGASTILYGILLEMICVKEGTTFDTVLHSQKIQAI